jgi:hypothetical protein
MKTALKNVKICEFASEETTCFQASLWVDGKRAASVSNDGRGGCHRYYFDDHELEKKLNDYCRSLLDHEFEFGGEKMTTPMNIDILIDNLLVDYEVNKQIKKLMKKKVVFELKSDPEGMIRTLPFAQRKGNLSEKDAIGYLENKYGEELRKIYNRRNK